MLVPEDTVTIEKAEYGYVARTSLIDELTATGHTRAEARANLDHAVRAYVRTAPALDKEVPQELRRPMTIKRVLLVAAFLAFVLLIKFLASYLSAPREARAPRSVSLLQSGGRTMAEKKIGRVTHYFGNINVAAIELEDELNVGDTIHIKGHTSDWTQPVDSMQIEHDSVESAGKGDSIGIKVTDHAREHDEVFKVVEDE
ncbi:MAG: type II toxin-antitoxin system HicB family antitoxin [Planctomycetota bacterium]